MFDTINTEIQEIGTEIDGIIKSTINRTRAELHIQTKTHKFKIHSKFKYAHPRRIHTSPAPKKQNKTKQINVCVVEKTYPRTTNIIKSAINGTPHSN